MRQDPIEAERTRVEMVKRGDECPECGELYMIMKNVPGEFTCTSCEIVWTPHYFEKFEGQP